METPIDMLRKRYNEIDEMYNISLSNGFLDDDLVRYKNMFKAGIRSLEWFNFMGNKDLEIKKDLNPYQVQQIRDNCKKHKDKKEFNSVSSFANRYGVSDVTILNVLNNRTYKKYK